MAYPNVTLDTIDSSQSQKEVTANALFEAESPAALFGIRSVSGLTVNYYGGIIMVDGVATAIANGNVALIASNTNYVECNRSGIVSTNNTGFTAGNVPLYNITTAANAISGTPTPARAWVAPPHLTSKCTITLTANSVTMNASQARAGYITTTGNMTANCNLVTPNDGQWTIYCNNTGNGVLTVKTNAGNGVTIAQTKRAIVFADGTDVVRITPDT